MEQTYQLTESDVDRILAQFDQKPAEFQPELDRMLEDIAEISVRETTEDPERWDFQS